MYIPNIHKQTQKKCSIPSANALQYMQTVRQGEEETGREWTLATWSRDDDKPVRVCVCLCLCWRSRAKSDNLSISGYKIHIYILRHQNLTAHSMFNVHGPALCFPRNAPNIKPEARRLSSRTSRREGERVSGREGGGCFAVCVCLFVCVRECAIFSPFNAPACIRKRLTQNVVDDDDVAG